MSRSEGLAPLIVEELLGVLARLVRDEGLSAIIVEQNPLRILAITDHALILERGTVVHAATSAVLRADAATLDRYLALAAAAFTEQRRGSHGEIVGAVATSHTPTIGFAFDRKKQDDPVWAPIFEAFQPIKQWLAQKKPDALIFIYNDHVTSFFFDHYSAFALGIGDAYAVADEGGGPRALPTVPRSSCAGAAHWRLAGRRRVRHGVLPGPARSTMAFFRRCR